tara:strand:- start:36 stop:482 length:447 start_codon:yes stop_codon:yes gene_type:complete
MIIVLCAEIYKLIIDLFFMYLYNVDKYEIVAEKFVDNNLLLIWFIGAIGIKIKIIKDNLWAFSSSTNFPRKNKRPDHTIRPLQTTRFVIPIRTSQPEEKDFALLGPSVPSCSSATHDTMSGNKALVSIALDEYDPFGTILLKASPHGI